MTTELRAAAEQALELTRDLLRGRYRGNADQVSAALYDALSQPEPRNQCGETCERARLCATCMRGLDEGGGTEGEGRAYEEGWRAAASWAERDDLVSDIGSPAYTRERDAALGRCEQELMLNGLTESETAATASVSGIAARQRDAYSGPYGRVDASGYQPPRNTWRATPAAPRRLTDAEVGRIWFEAKIPGLTETNARLLIRAAERAILGEKAVAGGITKG